MHSITQPHFKQASLLNTINRHKYSRAINLQKITFKLFPLVKEDYYSYYYPTCISFIVLRLLFIDYNDVIIYIDIVNIIITVNDMH